MEDNILSSTLSRGAAEKLDIDDLEPIEVNREIIDSLVNNFDKDNPLMGVLMDYAFLREKILFNIEACSSILDYAMRGLRLNMGPKDIEACGSIIKVQNDSSQELLKIHEKIRIISKMLDGSNSQSAEGFLLSTLLKGVEKIDEEINA